MLSTSTALDSISIIFSFISNRSSSILSDIIWSLSSCHDFKSLLEKNKTKYICKWKWYFEQILRPMLYIYVFISLLIVDHKEIKIASFSWTKFCLGKLYHIVWKEFRLPEAILIMKNMLDIYTARWENVGHINLYLVWNKNDIQNHMLKKDIGEWKGKIECDSIV